MSTPRNPSTPVVVTETEARKVAFAAFVGTALEWYDYFLYGTAAAVVFNALYFVTDDPLVSTLAAFASFAVGFLARPVGAMLFGHLGDRIGRRKTLI
ncbi:MAG: MFS transporter, partial [Micromonosporaceae bacterium]|nr:MFS transporter [Micromonosporaceae bacterium]